MKKCECGETMTKYYILFLNAYQYSCASCSMKIKEEKKC
jgi:hypothetical protein